MFTKGNIFNYLTNIAVGRNSIENFIMIKKCKICGNSNQNIDYIAREMMMGSRDKFEYFECSKCGCLQIAEIPINLVKYYPENYYSFSEYFSEKLGVVKLFLRRQRTKYFIKKKNIFGWFYTKIKGAPHLPDWIKLAKLELDLDILDVGCGNGNLLLRLSEQGFSNLTGVDPFIKNDIFYDNGVKIFKQELVDLKQKFDFIMLNHSLEHIPEQLSMMITLNKKVKSNGAILIRIPTVSSFSWRKYKTDWVQLDAPRHLFLHSINSISLLAEKAGFAIEFIEYDSTEFQFYGSEQYLRDISLSDERSYTNNPDGSIFTDLEIKRFQEKANDLNNARDGDQVCVLLRKI